MRRTPTFTHSQYTQYTRSRTHTHKHIHTHSHIHTHTHTHTHKHTSTHRRPCIYTVHTHHSVAEHRALPVGSVLATLLNHGFFAIYFMGNCFWQYSTFLPGAPPSETFFETGREKEAGLCDWDVPSSVPYCRPVYFSLDLMPRTPAKA